MRSVLNARRLCPNLEGVVDTVDPLAVALLVVMAAQGMAAQEASRGMVQGTVDLVDTAGLVMVADMPPMALRAVGMEVPLGSQVSVDPQAMQALDINPDPLLLITKVMADRNRQDPPPMHMAPSTPPHLPQSTHLPKPNSSRPQLMEPSSPMPPLCRLPLSNTMDTVPSSSRAHPAITLLPLATPNSRLVPPFCVQ